MTEAAQLKALKKESPALFVLLNDMPEFRLTPGCGGCPYATQAPPCDPDLCEGCANHESSEEDDAWFVCKLLQDQKVWGEQPECTEKDWRKQARAEALGLIGKRLPAP